MTNYRCRSLFRKPANITILVSEFCWVQSCSFIPESLPAGRHGISQFAEDGIICDIFVFTAVTPTAATVRHSSGPTDQAQTFRQLLFDGYLTAMPVPANYPSVIPTVSNGGYRHLFSPRIRTCTGLAGFFDVHTGSRRSSRIGLLSLMCMGSTTTMAAPARPQHHGALDGHWAEPEEIDGGDYV